jgi:DNA-binding transcriptional MerR regulator
VTDDTRPPPEAPAEPAADEPGSLDWRIDDLARMAGITVDTIRYYQREGLLPSGERAGRARRYGPEHLERLERIRALQSRRFSLAAIRALLEREAPGALEGLLAGNDDAYDFDELVGTAAMPPALARELIHVGLLREPADHGRAAFDGDDLSVLRAFADMRRVGIPDAMLVELARLYASAYDELQRRLVALFTGASTKWAGGAPTELSFGDSSGVTAPAAARLARDMRVISDYTQQRNLQRQVLLALEHGVGPDAAADESA